MQQPDGSRGYYADLYEQQSFQSSSLRTLLQIIMFSPTFAWSIVTWPGLFVGSRTLRPTIRRRGFGASAESPLLSRSASHITLAPVSIGTPPAIDNR